MPTAAPRRRRRPSAKLRMSADQPVLMRIVFAPATTASEVRQAIKEYPVCDLPGAPTASTADDGAQLMLWCAPPEGDAYASEVKRRSRCEIDRIPYAGGESVADGGMAFRVVDADPLALRGLAGRRGPGRAAQGHPRKAALQEDARVARGPRRVHVVEPEARGERVILIHR